ncbi:MAG: helix-turn-helix domain-containing protein [Gammaproteobacteria bacterium]
MGRQALLPEAIYEHDFARLARIESHPRTRLRFLGLAHVQEGRSYEEIARMLKVHAKSVHAWVQRLAEGGLEAVHEQPGRGAKRKLPLEMESSLAKAILELQAQSGRRRVCAEDVRQLLATRFGVRCGLSTVYDLLHRANIDWRHQPALEKRPIAFKGRQPIGRELRGCEKTVASDPRARRTAPSRETYQIDRRGASTAQRRYRVV